MAQNGPGDFTRPVLSFQADCHPIRQSVYGHCRFHSAMVVRRRPGLKSRAEIRMSLRDKESLLKQIGTDHQPTAVAETGISIPGGPDGQTRHQHHEPTRNAPQGVYRATPLRTKSQPTGGRGYVFRLLASRNNRWALRGYICRLLEGVGDLEQLEVAV